MRIFIKATAIAVLAVGFVLPGVAAAQVTYPAPPPPEIEQCVPDDDTVDSDGPGGTDDEVNCDTTEVRPVQAEQTTTTTTGSSTVVVPTQTAAPSGSLPITGGDVLGMTVIALVALTLGTVLMRRSRAMKRDSA